MTNKLAQNIIKTLGLAQILLICCILFFCIISFGPTILNESQRPTLAFMVLLVGFSVYYIYTAIKLIKLNPSSVRRKLYSIRASKYKLWVGIPLLLILNAYLFFFVHNIQSLKDSLWLLWGLILPIANSIAYLCLKNKTTVYEDFNID